MKLSDRVEAFVKLGNYLRAIDEAEQERLNTEAKNENAWFTGESVGLAIRGVCQMLGREALNKWLSAYTPEPSPRTIAIVMAGNIPLVGFHDFLCVLISGHRLQIKPSSKDTVLIKYLIQKLTDIEPRFAERISMPPTLRNFDAVIATGSDNSARYFEYYFGKYPHIIRKNRTSVAILTGFEPADALRRIGEDVFAYFGLGCRNVSKLFVPADFNFSSLIRSWEPFADVMNHHKYHNNYDYQKAILLVNKADFLDTGFVLLQENMALVSPIAVVYYEKYDTWESLPGKLHAQQDKIQCMIGTAAPAEVKPGFAQLPGLSDYADGVDIMAFLRRDITASAPA